MAEETRPALSPKVRPSIPSGALPEVLRAENQPEIDGERPDPVDVFPGLGTRDEMCFAWLLTTGH